MSTNHNENGTGYLDDNTQSLILAVREVYRPEPLSPAIRAALRSSIEARAGKKPRHWAFATAVTAATAAAILSVWLLILHHRPCDCF